jgi:hypothetical protein
VVKEVVVQGTIAELSSEVGYISEPFDESKDIWHHSSRP